MFAPGRKLSARRLCEDCGTPDDRDRAVSIYVPGWDDAVAQRDAGNRHLRLQAFRDDLSFDFI